MTKEVRRAIANNLNEKVYLKNINRVTFIKRDTDTKNLVTEPDMRKVNDLDYLETDLRHSNLKVYLSNMFYLRRKQFMLFGLPVVLILSTALSFTKPLNKVVTTKKNCYVLNEKVLEQDVGQIDLDEKKYYEESFKEHDYLEENASAYYGGSVGDSLNYQISDGIQSLIAHFTLSSDGKLSFANVRTGEYIDVNNYDFTNASEIEERYSMLFDEILNLLRSSDKLSEDELSILNNLNESDKKKIMITIYDYTNLGKQEVSYNTKSFALRVILSLLCFIYALLILSYYNRKRVIFEGTELYNSDGELRERYHEEVGIFHVGLKYDEAFLAAERDRIKNIIELVDEIVLLGQDDILTKYEKKLRK